MQKVIHWNCLEVLRRATPNSIDAIVTDPPYWLSFMWKKWDYDVPSVEIWQECLRVLKPWWYLLAFAGTRTQHRMAVRIEDAGFEIRDMIAWVYGSGFPKSLNIGKAVDKLQGNEREVVGINQNTQGRTTKWENGESDYGGFTGEDKTTLTKWDSEWEWWGTALKPALEPITVARKPLDEKTVAENCLKWGVGGINIDGSRVEYQSDENPQEFNDKRQPMQQGIANSMTPKRAFSLQGRFPANLIHDGSDEVVELFPNTKSGAVKQFTNNGANQPINLGGGMLKPTEGSEGSASRFFYCAKASKSERNKGLDGSIQVNIIGALLSNTSICENPDQSLVPLLDMELSPKNDTWEYLIQMRNEWDLNTTLFGKESFERYLNECNYTIKTETSWTISQAILNWLSHFIIKEYTADVKWEIEFGGNLVESVEWWKMLKTTIKGQMEYLLGVKTAVSEIQLIIKEKENKNFHSTVKPIALMEYLVKLVSREWALVLDPFAWSGSTLLACKNLGRGYVGIEMDEEYIKIINARLWNTPKNI